VHPSQNDSRKAVGVNMKKIPNLEGIGMDAEVSQGYTVFNKNS